eukprot:12425741-Alexandrium_andersonii.AAC.1
MHRGLATGIGPFPSRGLSPAARLRWRRLRARSARAVRRPCCREVLCLRSSGIRRPKQNKSGPSFLNL